jgi:uncharacterized protein YbjT (DUF2867 family)
MATILVTTPTGHIGSRVVDQLLAAPGGHTVRVLARDPGRLAPAVRERADVRTGALDEGDALARALDGADRLFFLIPPPRPDIADWLGWMHATADHATRAVEAAGSPRTVFLSSTGAHRSDLGPVSALGKVEQQLAGAVSDLAVLRPGYFFENTLNAVPTIAGQGAMYGVFAPDLAFPQLATRDIGDAAARLLTDDGWRGHHVHALHGPHDLSMRDLAANAAAALGRPVQYVQVPVEAVAAGMAQAGLGESMVREYSRMLAGLANSGFEHPEPRTADTTTPTTFAVWAAEALRPAVEGAGALAGAAG